jgi:5'-3' exonuclease
MGIPYYFSYVLQNHPKIFCKYNKKVVIMDELYVDSNSIIYEMVHKYGVDDWGLLFEKIKEKLDELMTIFTPKYTMIAFDGIPPFAKMEQQRQRRYKNWLFKEIKENYVDTSFISPGTEFMNNLDDYLSGVYSGVNGVEYSGSREKGEAEHKIFERIRDKGDIKTNKLVYGLDADLIMLCLIHNKMNMFIYRESDVLNKEKLGIEFEEGVRYIINIKLFGDKLCEGKKGDYILNYIFICFFLGNDFLPHFPAYNIRTGGIFKLLDKYDELGAEIIINNEINWGTLKKYIDLLAKDEHTNICEEYEKREKMEKMIKYKKEVNMEEMPLMERTFELHIDPFNGGWEERYYGVLFEGSGMEIKRIGYNYLQTLEWCFYYYTKGCIDWDWKYNHYYPPLLIDLGECIPLKRERSKQVEWDGEKVLDYILPGKYKEKYDIQWCFCKYLWESHIYLP